MCFPEFPPPISRHNPFSAWPRGRNFSLFSRVVAVRPFTSKPAQDAKCVSVAPVFSAPVHLGHLVNSCRSLFSLFFFVPPLGRFRISPWSSKRSEVEIVGLAVCSLVPLL